MKISSRGKLSIYRKAGVYEKRIFKKNDIKAYICFFIGILILFITPIMIILKCDLGAFTEIVSFCRILNLNLSIAVGYIDTSNNLFIWLLIAGYCRGLIVIFYY